MHTLARKRERGEKPLPPRGEGLGRGGKGFWQYLNLMAVRHCLPSLHSMTIKTDMKTFNLSFAAFSLLLCGTAVFADSSGTGFFVSPAGYLVTNYHVVKDGTCLKVKFGAADVRAEVVAKDEVNDIALLQIASQNRPADYMEVNTGRSPALGSNVFTIGFPDPLDLGNNAKYTNGAISARSGGPQADPRFLQISVPIQPGNSGGPLVESSSGRVIGIITWKLNVADTYKKHGYIPENVGFALKAAYLWGLLDQVPDSALETTTARPKNQPSKKAIEQTAENAVAQILSLTGVCDEYPETVRIGGGEFMMGSEDGGPEEKPVHLVQVAAFSMGKFEVTQGQWRRVMGKNPAYFQDCGDDCPVESVSLTEVLDFIDQLNRQTGRHYRLPTEAEWEYACRSGGQNQTYCGGEKLDDLAWHQGNAEQKTHPVGKKKPNGLGLFDMSGNVSEFTCSAQDAYKAGVNDRSESRCASIVASGAWEVRGGSWFFGPEFRSTSRAGGNPSQKGKLVGFRLAED